MAYFANGSEGEILEEQCGDCPLEAGWNDPDQQKLFEIDKPMRPCPVRLVQLSFNYNQIREHGCDVTADYLEKLFPVPKFVERVTEGNTMMSYGSSESQLKSAIDHLRSDDLSRAMTALVNDKGICQVREQLKEIRLEQEADRHFQQGGDREG